MTSQVEALINKAVSAADANDAMKFSQAACNAASALNTVAVMQAMNLTPKKKGGGK